MAEVVLGQQRRGEFPCDWGGGTDLCLALQRGFILLFGGVCTLAAFGHPGGSPMFPIQADHPHYSSAVPQPMHS